MTEADALEFVQAAIWAVIVTSAPAVVGAMAIGLVVALFQALTQIQEVTLTFVPKIMAILAISISSAHFMGASVWAFAKLAYSRIESGF